MSECAIPNGLWTCKGALFRAEFASTFEFFIIYGTHQTFCRILSLFICNFFYFKSSFIFFFGIENWCEWFRNDIERNRTAPWLKLRRIFNCWFLFCFVLFGRTRHLLLYILIIEMSLFNRINLAKNHKLLARTGNHSSVRWKPGSLYT